MRATILSLQALVGRLSAIVTTLVMGYIIDFSSATLAVRLMHSIMLLSIIFMLFLAVPRHGREKMM